MGRAAGFMAWAASCVIVAAGCGPRAGAKPDPHDSAPMTTPTVDGRIPCLSNVAYVDADGDGYGSSDAPTVACSGYPPPGFVSTAGDCNDNDASAFRLYNHDADGDGVGAADDTICAGDHAPVGYVLEAGVADCDDTNPAISFPYLVDADGDGDAPPNAAIVCGPKDHPPPNAVVPGSYPGDCDDNDPTVRSLYYQDLDGDGYAASNEVSKCGSPDKAPPGFGVFNPGQGDCDDTRPDVNPSALELWSDKIDSDCDGSLAPFGCSEESCDPDFGPVGIVAGCDAADLVITAVRAKSICYEVHWVVVVANQGTAPISDFTLVIDGPNGTTTYAVGDPLPPGRQHSYPLPDRQLAGEVRFSVKSSASDCNGLNNTRSVGANPLDCSH